jgi:glycolate oxidase iron-sulfur subunit
MQTHFTREQLQDPEIARSEKILRTCVHCGMCTATCPTYVLLGDELDSPRGRIYLIKDMLENGRPATKEVVQHIDRCLSCLACTTTCPSGVDYMHLIDHARAYVERTYDRPLIDRLMRRMLVFILPHPTRFRIALYGAWLARPMIPVIERLPIIGKRMAAMLRLAPSRLPTRSATEGPQVFAPINLPRKKRVAILSGCAQPVLRPSINEATIELLSKLGVEVVQARGEGCCGALAHHLGSEEGHDHAARLIEAWMHEVDGEGLDAIIITASGCGTTIKDYGHMFQDNGPYARKAAHIAALAMDITEFLATLDLPKSSQAQGLTVAYHSACSMQHGQKITTLPKELLKQAGFVVKDVPEGHLCCGSAGTYNILQPEIADQLRARKVANIEKTKPDLIATGNIGCITQIALGTEIPLVHTIELLNWAYGGTCPDQLQGLQAAHVSA